MEKFFLYFRLIILMFVLVSSAELYADSDVDGTTFWFAIPTARTAIGEPARGYTTGAAQELFITSQTDATVEIYTATNDFTTPYKTVQVRANEQKIVSLLKHTQDTVGERLSGEYGYVSKKAYYVSSDQPISLMVNIAYNWTGESFRVLPIEELGLEHYTLNLYNDWVNMYDHPSPPGGSYRDHPGQILVVATEDNTQVTYTPTADTRIVKAGESKTVTLNKGEVYFIFSKIDPYTHQWESTDLSGTRVVADKKIAVFSGHTKGVFPKYNPSFYHGLKADFSRNLLIESIAPIESLGNEYITVPNIYNNRWTGREYQGKHENERGDLIRFVATQDNTTIWEVNANGEEVPLWTQLKRGEYRDSLNRETPGHFRSNHPILVGQYGKGWFWWSGNIVYKEGEASDKEDELQNPARMGQGMLYTVTPVERWTNYAEFVPLINTNSNVNIIFKTGDEDRILYRELYDTNPPTLKQKFSTSIKTIGNGEYSYICATVNEGYQAIQATAPSVKFAVYSYGNQDASKDGFAYGYPANSNFYNPCRDTIIIDTVINAAHDILGTIAIDDLAADQQCAAIKIIKYETTSYRNATLSTVINDDNKNATFTVKFPDKSAEGYIKVIAISKSGNSLSREYYYIPDSIKSDKATIRFTRLKPNVPQEQSITISNPSSSKQITIKKLYLKNAEADLVINSSARTTDNHLSAKSNTVGLEIIAPSPATDIVIPPSGSVNVTIKAFIENDTVVTNELWAELIYYSVPLTTVKVNSTLLVLEVQDIDFGKVPLSNDMFTSITKSIHNSGNGPAIITGYKLKNAEPAFELECPDLIAASSESPLELEADASLLFRVTYMPMVADVDHTETLQIICENATDTIESVWTGRAVDNGGTSVQCQTLEDFAVFPNPASEFININEAMLSGANNIEIYNALGVKVLDVSPAVSRVNISKLPSGVYTIKCGDRVQNFVKY